MKDYYETHLSGWIAQFLFGYVSPISYFSQSPIRVFSYKDK
jgi:hypothetical protein